MALRLDNADTSIHYLDIDEFNVHAPMPSGPSSVAIFQPMQAGTFTFYCHPHADKAAGTGMVGRLIVGCSLYSPWIIRPSSPDRLTTSAAWLSLLWSSCQFEEIWKERRWLESSTH